MSGWYIRLDVNIIHPIKASLTRCVPTRKTQAPLYLSKSLKRIADHRKSHYTRPNYPQVRFPRGKIVAETGLNVKKELYRILYLQLLLILGLAAMLLFLHGIKSGISTVLGGMAYWLPTLFFVRRVFAKTSARAAKEFVLAFFAGEAFKLILSAVLFVLIVKYLPVTLLAVLAGYIGAIVAFWIAAVVYLSRQAGVSE